MLINGRYTSLARTTDISFHPGTRAEDHARVPAQSLPRQPTESPPPPTLHPHPPGPHRRRSPLAAPPRATGPPRSTTYARHRQRAIYPNGHLPLIERRAHAGALHGFEGRLSRGGGGGGGGEWGGGRLRGGQGGVLGQAGGAGDVPDVRAGAGAGADAGLLRGAQDGAAEQPQVPVRAGQGPRRAGPRHQDQRHQGARPPLRLQRPRQRLRLPKATESAARLQGRGGIRAVWQTAGRPG